ncbi:MAG: hypothetical protein HWN65_20445 [Candidatus Helarchaeota archaeon]|nr:hypothetical protein [Candidatus Helarchaeota archaeon]
MVEVKEQLELGVAYHGNVYLDHARSDFKEIQEHGCNSILLAMSEYDFEQWRGRYFKMARIAKEEFDFSVYVNFWAWGRIFGGEAPSVFLSNNAEFRQVFSKTKNPFPAACFNTKAFQKYIIKAVRKVATVAAVDGFFWDEPHYAYSEENLLPTNLTPYYVCYCKTCQDLFFEQYQYAMPSTKIADVILFKEQRLLGFLQNLCQMVKSVDSHKKNIICVMPSHVPTGMSNWDLACFESMDVLATDPYWMLFQKDLQWVQEESKKLVTTAKKHKKGSQLWVLAFRIPKGREVEIPKAVEIFHQSGADSIFAWLYRGGLQTFVKSDDPALVWETVGAAFKRLRESKII